MTTRHLRDAVAYAKGLGLHDARIEHGGRHPHLVATTPGGKPLRYTLPSSPSDGRRGQRNVQADLRRALREPTP